MGSSEKSRTLYVSCTSAGPRILAARSKWLKKLEPNVAHWHSPTATSEKKIHRRAAGVHLGPLTVHGCLETSAAAVQQRSMLDQQARYLTFILLSKVSKAGGAVGISYVV